MENKEKVDLAEEVEGISLQDSKAIPQDGKHDAEDTEEFVVVEGLGDNKEFNLAKNSFMEFIKTILTFKGDVVSLTCPTFILSGISLLELGVHWGDFINLFIEIKNGKTPEERVMLASKWYISTFYHSFYYRGDNAGPREKKPYNPILGEEFYARWDDKEYGQTNLISEQVSHHPPITAVHMENEKQGVYLNGFLQQKLKFSGTTLMVEQVGKMTLFFKETNELISVSLPSLAISGLLTASPYLEVVGKCYMKSSMGIGSVMEFYKKPWLFGDYHKFDGTIFSEGSGSGYGNGNGNDANKDKKEKIPERKEEVNPPKEGREDTVSLHSSKSTSSKPKKSKKRHVFYEIAGFWNSKSTCIYRPLSDSPSSSRASSINRFASPSPSSRSSSTTSSSLSLSSSSRENSSEQVFLEADKLKRSIVKIHPPNRQSEFESQKVWRDVTKSLLEGDMKSASYHKNDIEERQRKIARERKDDNVEWKPKLFVFIKHKDIINSDFRASLQHLQKDCENTNDGMWVHKSMAECFTSA
ncbi:Protein KES1 [Zancudomyces culisetae]|uniref:Protein KES1 n=1 Tax=Zancudomyces culisetae TaxID=1213189 RepID=A0A1R1PXT9_ZANCU|nr:Protein KES1 [Zancudomyces culisetae]|eukprot:OMH85770.1 Protein KES1 [Zancudomyces culisetae]